MKNSYLMLDSLVREIQLFNHPLIDNNKNKISTDFGSNGAFTLAVELYDNKSNSVIDDVKICEGYNMPGMLVTFIPKKSQLRIENAYLKEEYQDLSIGTGFVKHLFDVSKNYGFNRVSLVADEDTNAETYWKHKHDFIVPDNSRPLYLEKRI